MKRAAATHAGHDELLIARLYGDDVDDLERSRALELVASCEECALLLADLGAIANATSALPVRPSRTRDFSLTEEDAARLRPRHSHWARLTGIGRRRSFGGALAALGFSGLVLTSALSMFGATATSASLDAQRNAFAPAAGGLSSENYSGGNATAALAATAAPAKVVESAGPTEASTQVGVQTPPPPAVPSPATLGPASPGALDQSTASGALTVTAGGTPAASAPGAPPGEPAAATMSQPGPDGRLLVLAGSGVALVVGLLLLLAPIIRRRSRGGARR
jgi:hypothetical protein